MSNTYNSSNRAPNERIFHALLFECLATLICAPLFAYIMDQSILAMGSLTLLFATIAMLWNMVYNYLFDRLYKKLTRSFWVRLGHALLFELGLIFLLVPLAAWWLYISLMAAFWMDIGMILFFLPYAVVFNWGYDMVRKKLWLRKQAIAALNKIDE